MKTIFSIVFFLAFTFSVSAQSQKQEILTVTVQWVSTPIGKSMAYVSAPDGTVTSKELEGKLNLNGLPDVTGSLTVLLNEITQDGWVLLSATPLKDSFNTHLFIFERMKE